MFYVVQLDSEIFIEKLIVPSLWLDKYNTLCLLPPTADTTEVERIAKTQSAPKHGWQMHSVSFIQSFDTYSQAKENIEKSRREPEMVDLEDEEEEQECHQKVEREARKRKRPAFFENYSTETDGEEGGRSTMPDNSSVEGGISMPDPFIVKEERMEDTAPLESHHQRQDTTDYSRKLSVSKNFHESHLQVPQDCSPNAAQTMQSINTKCPCNSSCHKVILESLATMQTQLKDNSRMLHQIMEQLTSNVGPSLNAANTLPGAPANFPVTLAMRELNELQLLNNFLSDQHNFSETIPHFSVLGGSLPRQILRRIMETFLSNELCTKLNWKGRGDKHPFKAYTKIHSLILYVAKQNRKGRLITLSDVENYAKDWLKLAPGRIAAKRNQNTDDDRKLRF